MIKHYKLPNDVLMTLDFNAIQTLRPDEKSKIILHDKQTGEFRDRQIFRSYMSYLNTPDFDSDVKKSYMFVNKSEELPKIFDALLNHVKSIDSRYNQMVVNWYNPEEYIELHRDCASSMISDDAEILMVNLNETDSLYDMRTFHMISSDDKDFGSVPLLNGHLYHITNNKTHRHFTGKGTEKRISITFRMMRD
jgi:hypothetical protein